MKSRGVKTFNAINVLLMLIILFICLFPFIYMFSLSFSSPKAVINGKVLFYPVDINIQAYKTIVEYPSFFTAYRNTVFYTVAGTGISMLMTLLFAYPLSKSYLKGTKLIMRFVIVSMFFTGGLIPNYLVVSWLKLTDKVWAILIPFAINQFNLIILISFLRNIPESLEEAAMIDGMNYFGILFKIVLPLSLPAIATVSLYCAVFFWNDWFYGLMYLNSTELYPVMLFLRNIVKGSSIVGSASGSGAADKTTISITIKSAAIILTTVPIMCLYPFLQKYFVKGMVLGSVKG